MKKEIAIGMIHTKPFVPAYRKKFRGENQFNIGIQNLAIKFLAGLEGSKLIIKSHLHKLFAEITMKIKKSQFLHFPLFSFFMNRTGSYRNLFFLLILGLIRFLKYHWYFPIVWFRSLSILDLAQIFVGLATHQGKYFTDVEFLYCQLFACQWASIWRQD